MDHNLAVSTVVGMLRLEATRRRHEHGELVEREGGLFLTPSQMEKLADWLEGGRAGLVLPVEDGPELPYTPPAKDPYLEGIMAHQPLVRRRLLK